MKRKYEKPVFIAEAYEFNESIATCGISISGHASEPITITEGIKLCVDDKGKIDNGHRADGKGTYALPTTIFNDGPDKGMKENGCEFDWNGDHDAYYRAFTNNPPGNNKNHNPAYNGQTFQS